MAIGRTFKEAFQKGLRALETGRPGWATGPRAADDRLPDDTLEALRGALRQPTPERIFQVKRALERGLTVADVYELTAIDPWFLNQMAELIEAEREYAAVGDVSARRSPPHEAHGVLGSPARARCAARREAPCASGAGRWACGRRTRWSTPAPASFRRRRRISTATTTRRAKRRAAGERSVVILGSGPNRIGQGVEFDYCCVRAVHGAAPAGIRDDHDQLESRNRVDRLRHVGQAVLRAAHVRGRARDRASRAAGRRHRAARRSDAAQAHAAARGGGREDSRHVARLDRHRRGSPPVRQDRAPARAHAAAQRHGDERRRSAWRSRSGSGIRCSCGRRTCSADARCRSSTTRRRCAITSRPRRACPRSVRCSIDRFLEDAFECDVDAISDGSRVVIGGIMQHIEDAGIHSGDSACVLPPYLVGESDMQAMREQTVALAHGARRRWADQRAVRDQGRRRLRARGESAREPHDPVRVEGDRRAARVARRARDDG